MAVDGMGRDPFAPLDGAPPSPATAAATGDGWAPILPAPHPLPDELRHRRHGAPAATWHYRDADGALLFVVCRFDRPDGGKEMIGPHRVVRSEC